MKKMFKNRLIAVVILVLSVLMNLVACGKTTTSSNNGSETKKTEVNKVKIAALINITGSSADAGKQAKQGIELLTKRINDAGGIKSLGGAKIELVIGDTMSDTNQCKAVAERILSDKSIVAAFGASGSAYAMPMLPVFEKAGVPFACLNISDSISQQGYKYVFQNNTLGSQFGKTQVDFFKFVNDTYKLGIDKIGIIYENSEYGLSTAKGNKDIAIKAGLKVVYEESFPIGMSDASALVLKMKDSGAQAIFPVAFSQDAKLLFNTMKSMKYSPLVIGGGAGFLMPAMSQELGEGVNGLISVAQLNWDSKSVTNSKRYPDISKEYEATYKEFATEHSLLFFSCLQTIIDALEKSASTDKNAIRDAMEKLEVDNIQPGGQLDFNEKLWNLKAYPVMVQWQKDSDGVFRPRTIYPQSEAAVEYKR